MTHSPDPTSCPSGPVVDPPRQPAPARAALRRAAQWTAAAAFGAWLLSGIATDAGHALQPQTAYIGPGAGIALGGSFLAIFLALFTALLMILLLPLRILYRLCVMGLSALGVIPRRIRPKVRRAIVLGLDGLEPSLTEQFMAEGLLPNLKRLKDAGAYTRLGTTWPPLSPVAWSSFSTGTNPGKHNIFDFINRTPHYAPTMSSVRLDETQRRFNILGFKWRRKSAAVTGLRKSKPFWTVLGEFGVFSSILRVPITYPPDKFKGLQLSAMCVPDLRGTLGMFTWYTETGAEEQMAEGGEGGDKLVVQRDGRTIRSHLRGPANPANPAEKELKIPFTVTPGGKGGATATLHVDGESVPLKLGAFSEFVKVAFRVGGGGSLNGIARFYLKRFDAPFELYCSPIQIDPDKPVLPISNPVYYSSYLARRQGPFATLGLAEDTGALDRGVLDEDAFLQHAWDIHAEREQMFFEALANVRRGAIVCVFDGSDRIQHMFWRFQDDRHPALRPEQRASHRDVIRKMYVRMDELVGRTMARLGKQDALFVMSDHGFKPFRRGVDLNAWLRDQGYLKLKDGKTVASGAWLKDIDWSQTRAYALGLAGIFINQKGRESGGIVAAGDETTRLVAEICRQLSGLKDDEAPGAPTAIRAAIPRGQAYQGPYTQNAPDILVGYEEGYRVSWDAAIGKAEAHVFADNLKAWSGDHCVHPEIAPGILFADRPLARPDARIIDLGPTILDLFGIATPAYMDGKSLLCPTPAA